MKISSLIGPLLLTSLVIKGCPDERGTPLVGSDLSTCSIKRSLPIGRASQGGYEFNYQSREGAECIEYRIRNRPGKLMTPVLWKDPQKTLLSFNLAECKPHMDCEWKESVHIWAGPIAKGPTELSYGMNRDEFTDSADAFDKAETKERSLSFSTILHGAFADPKSNVHAVGIQVSSFVQGQRPYTLSYTMILSEYSESLRVLHSGNLHESGSTLGLMWQSAASDAFSDYLKNENIKLLSPDRRKIYLEIKADDLEVDESNLLCLIQDGKCIAATTAPAYKPKNSPQR